MTHQFREDGSHYNGGADWFGYGYSAVGEPRLKMIRRWTRRGPQKGQCRDSFHVDGRPVATYEDAIEALRAPPILTDAEQPILALFTDEWGKRPSGDRGIMFDLRAKGFIEASDGLFRITSAGRAALTKETSDAE